MQITVNKRPLEKPVFFGTRPTQITFDDDDRDFLGSICIPSDCEKEGFVRLKNRKCLKPKSCKEDETFVFSTEFSNNINGTEIKFQEEDSQITTCCLTNDELIRRKRILSQSKNNEILKTIKDTLKKNACAELLQVRSALVTIPESCPRGQTITHDGECKYVRVWKSRPKRNVNTNNRIRQMMRYIRALRRRSRPTFE